MKNNFKSYKFWIALLAAIIVLINALGATFGFTVNEVAITSIATAVLGVFVTLGFVKKDTEEENKDNINSSEQSDLEAEKTKEDTNEKQKKDQQLDNLDK